MKLENQVVSLELSERLKALGVSQNSYFGWVEDDGGRLVTSDYKDWINPLSAFTVAELGEMLPPKFATQRIDAKTPYWVCWTTDFEDADAYTNKMADAMTEADARARMLIYLLEQKLIEL